MVCNLRKSRMRSSLSRSSASSSEINPRDARFRRILRTSGATRREIASSISSEPFPRSLESVVTSSLEGSSLESPTESLVEPGERRKDGRITVVVRYQPSPMTTNGAQ